MARRGSAAETIEHIVALRQTRAAVDGEAGRRLAGVIRQLRRRLGPGIPKRQAAAALGVSVQALDRWVAAGRLPVVRRPGSSRELIPTDVVLALAPEVKRRRERGESRPLAAALAALAERGHLRRRLRPNQSAQELRYEFLQTTPAERLRQAIELSHVGAALAAATRTDETRS